MMTARIAGVLGALVLMSACGRDAERTEPVAEAPAPGNAPWIVEQFFLADSFPSMADYLGGEMLEEFSAFPSLGSTHPPEVRGTYRVLERRPERAIYAVSMTDGTRIEDWYAYLQPAADSAWKLHAVRRLLLPPIYHVALDSLAAKPDPSDADRRLLESMRLSVSSDSALKQYLLEHRSALQSLVARFRSLDDVQSVRGELGLDLPSAAPRERPIADALRTLRLPVIYRADRFANCVFVVVGGMGDNEVGFMHERSGCTPPVMTPEHIYYLEHIDGPWHIYRAN
jgi:hypothetical protein